MPSQFSLRIEEMQIHRGDCLAGLKEAQNILHPQTLEANMTINARASGMAQHLHVPHLCELLVHGGLVEMHIQPGSAKLAALQSLDQRVFVDQLASCDVNEAGAPLHLADLLGVDNRFAAERRGDQDAVRDFQHVVQVLVKLRIDLFLDARRQLANVVVQDVHAEALVSFLRNAETNLAQTDDPQAVSVRVVSVGCDVLLSV